jgi:leucyl aminopeptidase (aminopeptidase T)
LNERIKQLWEEAAKTTQSDSWEEQTKFMERFAELIVKECVDRVTSKANGWGDMTGFAIKESILDCAKDLKEHFGVEE